jgi:hypothetical protein
MNFVTDLQIAQRVLRFPLNDVNTGYMMSLKAIPHALVLDSYDRHVVSFFF